ncbi:MAG: hypothetical protein AB7P40_23280, partial [Chloroflexota bacterium]
PGAGFAAQDVTAPVPSPAPDRSPTYQADAAPEGALRVPGDPPAVGDVIVEDALAGPGLLPGGRPSCPSEKNLSEFVGEGYIIKIHGRCRPENTQAAMNIWPPVSGLVIPDGEIRLEAKVVSGGDRTALWIMFRGQTDPRQEYLLAVTPGRGWAYVYKNGFGTTPALAGRSDLGSRYAPDDWNEYAIRLAGPNIWVLLNGYLILSASDAALDQGWLTFGARRLGDVEDNVEAAVVPRNLRISRLVPASSQ